MGTEKLFCLVWKDYFFDSKVVVTVLVSLVVFVYFCLLLFWPWWRMEIFLSTLKLCWESVFNSSSTSTCEERLFFFADC